MALATCFLIIADSNRKRENQRFSKKRKVKRNRIIPQSNRKWQDRIVSTYNLYRSIRIRSGCITTRYIDYIKGVFRTFELIKIAMKFIRTSVRTILLVPIIFFSCKGGVKTSLEIVSPLKGVNINADTLKIDPSIKQVVKFNNGISVEVPKNAFTDKNGKIVSDPVLLTLKKFDTPADIIASGIPMIYSQSDSNFNFESAGMFEIQGSSNNQPINIAKNKNLSVNYPSETYGDYDQFYFTETSEQNVRKGYWEKINETPESKSTLELESKGDFKLNFATDKYPELALLSSIEWRLATNHKNPNTSENSWVLKDTWTSAEISQPQFGIGDPFFSTELNFENGFIGSGAVVISPDSSRIITTRTPETKIWDRSGKLIKVIDKVSETYQPVEFLNHSYFIVERQGGDWIYNLEGKEMGFIEHSVSRIISKDESRIFFHPWGNPEIAIISDLKGGFQKSFPLSGDRNNQDFWGVIPHFDVSDSAFLVTNTTKGITIYNQNGELVKRKEGRYHYINCLGKNMVQVTNMDGSISIWNFKTDKTKKYPLSQIDLKNKLINDTWHLAGCFKIYKNPVLSIKEGDNPYVKLLDYKKSIVHETKIKYSLYSIECGIFTGYSNRSDEYVAYNINMNKEVIRLPYKHYGLWEGDEYPEFSKDKNSFLINVGNYCRLYDLNGKVITDFKKMDSLLYAASFRGDKIVSISENGVFRVWTKDGREISNRQIKQYTMEIGRFENQKLKTWNSVFWDSKEYTREGKLNMASGRGSITSLSKNVLLTDRLKGKVSLHPLFERKGANVYQLIIRTSKSEFITYVLLDEQTKEQIDNYTGLLMGRLNKEKERREKEYKFIRRMSVSNFGIYNWDRLIKEKNRIFVRADFKFDIPVELNDVTVFLVTDFNGKSVIKFYKNTWDQFSFNPDVPNQLVAILPDNKIARFTQDDFNKIGIERVKQDKKYVFSMKSSSGSIESLQDLENAF